MLRVSLAVVALALAATLSAPARAGSPLQAISEDGTVTVLFTNDCKSEKVLALASEHLPLLATGEWFNARVQPPKGKSVRACWVATPGVSGVDVVVVTENEMGARFTLDSFKPAQVF